MSDKTHAEGLSNEDLQLGKQDQREAEAALSTASAKKHSGPSTGLYLACPRIEIAPPPSYPASGARKHLAGELMQ